jgi:hypothetical protein
VSYYQWKSSIPDPSSFINNYIDYAALLTDAAHDFHEAVAFYLMSVVSQGLKMKLPNMPNGLRGNLYMILYGISSHSRKSTSMDIGRDVLQRAVPGVQLPANFTPGGLEEEIAERSSQPAAMFADEFSRIIDQMHHQSYMSGLRQFLLTMYANEDWEYVKTSKGKKKEKDRVVIERSHLCLLGNVTPSITKYLQPRDIEDGFMARFAIVNPEHKPPRKRIGELIMSPRQRNGLVLQLSKIRQACKNLAATEENGPEDAVVIEPDALDALDEYQEEIEQSKQTDIGLIMMERMGIISMKLAMLIALSRCDPTTMTQLRVQHIDALAAMEVARKWGKWGAEFAGSLYESDIDKHIRRASAWLVEYNGMMSRSDIAKRMKLSKRNLDEVQMTMIDRGIISLTEKRYGESTRPTLLWVLKDKPDDPVVLPPIDAVAAAGEVKGE